LGTVWAVIVAAGDGRRFGRQKQFASLAGRLVVEWSTTAARPCVDGVVLVVPADRLSDPDVHAGADLVVAGGASRSESVRAGLAVVPGDAEVILVHDAARPFASPQLFRTVIAAVRAGNAGAVPGVPVLDTIKRVEDGVVASTLDRSGLVAVQTPQAFRAEALRVAHASKGAATDDAALLEAAGFEVVVVEGELSNRKLTDAGDLDLFERLVAEGTGS
jgi:2-C-methyl-D-erythritol 4-phosphate cytidylyltransferase